LPSQQQLRWSQLRVGLTVLFASVTLAILIFLMSGEVGFGPKIVLKSYYENAGGLRVGAPVRLHGVGIGNVSGIHIVAARKQTPVEVTMKVSPKVQDLRKDSVTSLATAGVLGETFVDIDSSKATGPPVQSGDVLPTLEKPDLQDVVRSTQGTLENMQALLNRVDRILSFVESGEGSIGKLIYDDTLYRRLNASVNEVQILVSSISKGKGSVGKLIMSDEFYNKVNTSVDKLNRIVDDINAGQGTMGKLLKDPSLYNNANQTIAKASQLIGDIDEGRGTLGKLSKDEAFARKLDETITKLNLLATKLNSDQGTAGRFINDPKLYDNTNHLLTETRSLIKAIRENPKKYLTIHFRIF
jgi:phospholipid/cholesterol/gamma-HCH transport system substrate-binding protein